MPKRGSAAKESERREAILRLARRCAAEADPDRVLRILLEGAVELLDADDGGIARWEETRGVLFQVESFLPSTNRGLLLDLERSASGRAAVSRAPVVVNDYQSRIGLATPAGRLGVRAGLAVPLLQEGRLLGTLSVSRLRPDEPFTNEDAAALELLAGIGASVLVGQEAARLAAIARVRQDVLTGVAHDIGNPLTGVSLQLQRMRRLLDRTPDAPEALAQMLQRAEASVARMTRLVDELRDVAVLESGSELDLDPQPVDLVRLAQEIAADHQERSERHRIRVEASEESIVGVWDGARLQRVLDNLLSNAVKYSPQGGEVILGVRREGDHATLAVRDQGIGIPGAEMHRLFERFYRGRNVVGRMAGTGIGLAGARRIVEQHGGTIQAESNEGVGSTFTVRLPLKKDG